MAMAGTAVGETIIIRIKCPSPMGSPLKGLKDTYDHSGHRARSDKYLSDQIREFECQSELISAVFPRTTIYKVYPFNPFNPYHLD